MLSESCNASARDCQMQRYERDIAVMNRLFATLRNWAAKWARHLEGIDDPQGQYLLSLERRVQSLEEAQRGSGRTFTVPTSEP
jgi:hypothetical protein